MIKGLFIGLVLLAACVAVLVPSSARAESVTHHRTFLLSGVDMTDSVNGTTFWLFDQGHNVPYGTALTSGSDMSETYCVFAAGQNWCNLLDNLGLCVNVADDHFAYADSCVNGDTREEFARISVPGGWAEQNRHNGQLLYRYDPSSCTSNCGDVATGGTVGDSWNFPAS